MKIKKNLKTLYKDFNISESEKNAEIDFILEFVTGLNQKKLFLIDDLRADCLEKVQKIINERILTGKPIQQILGVAWFMGDKYKVTEDTLIPRPETELLVREAVKIINKNSFKSILDIGTGTGCIACEIAKNTQAVVLGVDISNSALRVALDNAGSMNLFNRAVFRKSDLFSNIKEKFDVIVSNPPYISPQDKNTLSKEVLKEPATALFTADDKGVEFYEKIIIQSKKYLNQSGYILFELGQGQSGYVSDIFRKNGFKVISVLKDLSEIERVIVGKLV